MKKIFAKILDAIDFAVGILIMYVIMYVIKIFGKER